VLLLARQTGKLHQQTQIANLIGRYEALNAASERYDQGLAMIFEHPELRRYLMDGEPLGANDPNRDRALLVADVMAGAIDHANRVANRFPDPAHQIGWQRIAIVAARRPIFQELLADMPYAFPDFREVISGTAEPPAQRRANTRAAGAEPRNER
jgi:hypothetical protein